MSDPDLSPPGSSSYDSDILTVGDGTWDGSRNTFLLPNLQGTNLETTQYNGMGNRFAGLDQYHSLIKGHGVIAAIVFILIVPAAIFSARYYHSNPRLALKLHIYLQVLTVLLTTVVIVLGWFAVGPERALSNPHHGIGIAIYVLVLFQFLWGALMHRLEKKRDVPPSHLPFKIYLHKWMGRGIAILGFVQIALGLTLYGSPRVLFILYAVAGALLLFAYFALDYYHMIRRPTSQADFYSDYGSYLSGSRGTRTELTGRHEASDEEKGGHHWLRNAALGATGLFAFKKWRDRRRGGDEEKEVIREDSRNRVSGRERPPAGYLEESYVSSRPPSRGPRRRAHSGSRLSSESWEHDTPQKNNNTWRNRILGATAGAGAFAGAKKLFGGRKNEDLESVDSRSYRPPRGNQSMVSREDVSRVASGQAPMSPEDPRRRDYAANPNMNSVVSGPPMTPTRTGSRRRPNLDRSSEDYMSYDSREYMTDPGVDEDRPQHMAQGDGHTLRESIATFGALAGFKEWNKRRKERKEQQRVDRERRQEMENADHFNRRHSGRYPRPQDASGRRASGTETLMTGLSNEQEHGFRGSNPELSRHGFASSQQLSSAPNTSMPPLPANAGTLPPSTSRVNVANDGYNLPPPPPGPPPAHNMGQAYPETGSLAMPQGAVQPDPNRLVQDNTVYNSSSQYPPVNQSNSNMANTLAGAGAGAALASQMQRDPRNDSPSRYRNGRRSRSNSRPPPPPAHGRNNSFSSLSQAHPGAHQNGDNSLQSPPVSVKVDMHNDGQHVTVRRLSEEEAANERRARRAERRNRRNSSISNSDNPASRPPLSSENRHRHKTPRIRPAANQPIAPVPAPPPSTSTLNNAPHNRPPSELNLPPTPQHSKPPATLSQNTLSPPAPNLNPQPRPPAMGNSNAYGQQLSGMGSVTSPGDAGTGTDVSAFADNRRRRRAERARKLEAARGAGGGGRRVEFE
ncbi:hypothetical protein MBLNU230_g2366t1 [Neophaeotheca triangularis]